MKRRFGRILAAVVLVVFAAIAFFGPQPHRSAETDVRRPFTPRQRKLLLGLARRALEKAVRSGEALRVDEKELPERFAEPGACFVTLTKNGRLRGCMGHTLPVGPLCQSVANNTLRSALQDRRFRPVRPSELAQIRIEISVLTRPKRLRFDSPDELLRKLRPGVDGVVLRLGARRATYLPLVWEHLSDKEKFLSKLSKKAGLPAGAWKSPEAVVLIYQAEAFAEPDGFP